MSRPLSVWPLALAEGHRVKEPVTGAHTGAHRLICRSFLRPAGYQNLRLSPVPGHVRLRGRAIAQAPESARAPSCPGARCAALAGRAHRRSRARRRSRLPLRRSIGPTDGPRQPHPFSRVPSSRRLAPGPSRRGCCFIRPALSSGRGFPDRRGECTSEYRPRT